MRRSKTSLLKPPIDSLQTTKSTPSCTESYKIPRKGRGHSSSSISILKVKIVGWLAIPFCLLAPIHQYVRVKRGDKENWESTYVTKKKLILTYNIYNANLPLSTNLGSNFWFVSHSVIIAFSLCFPVRPQVDNCTLAGISISTIAHPRLITSSRTSLPKWVSSSTYQAENRPKKLMFRFSWMPYRSMKPLTSNMTPHPASLYSLS